MPTLFERVLSTSGDVGEKISIHLIHSNFWAMIDTEELK
jgi:hypothetical protein